MRREEAESQMGKFGNFGGGDEWSVSCQKNARKFQSSIELL